MRSIIPENLLNLSLVVSEKKAGQEKPEIGRFFKPEVTDQKSGSTFSIPNQYLPSLKISWKSVHASRRNRVRKIIIMKSTDIDKNRLSRRAIRPAGLFLDMKRYISTNWTTFVQYVLTKYLPVKSYGVRQISTGFRLCRWAKMPAGLFLDITR